VHLKPIVLERAAIPYIHDEDDGQGEYEKYPAALFNLLHMTVIIEFISWRLSFILKKILSPVDLEYKMCMQRSYYVLN
jgi:hypothetical protein